MTHPNRGAPAPTTNPTPEQIRAARKAAGLTQGEAAALIYGSLRAFQEWESGGRRMHPQLWESFLQKAGLKS